MTKAELKRQQMAALIEAMKAGYAADKDATSPHLFSSDMDSAWRIGRWCRWVKACACPVSVAPTRGYGYRVRWENSAVDAVIYAPSSPTSNPTWSYA